MSKRYIEVSWSATLHIGGTRQVPLDEDMREDIVDAAREEWEDIDPEDLPGIVSDMGEEWMRPGAVHPVMDWAEEAIAGLSWSDVDYDDISTRLVEGEEAEA